MPEYDDDGRKLGRVGVVGWQPTVFWVHITCPQHSSSAGLGFAAGWHSSGLAQATSGLAYGFQIGINWQTTLQFIHSFMLPIDNP